MLFRRKVRRQFPPYDPPSLALQINEEVFFQRGGTISNNLAKISFTAQVTATSQQQAAALSWVPPLIFCDVGRNLRTKTGFPALFLRIRRRQPRDTNITPDWLAFGHAVCEARGVVLWRRLALARRTQSHSLRPLPTPTPEAEAPSLADEDGAFCRSTGVAGWCTGEEGAALCLDLIAMDTSIPPGPPHVKCGVFAPSDNGL